MTSTHEGDRAAQSRSILIGGSTFLLWGILPIYWKLLAGVPAYEIIANRVFWSFVFMVAVLFALGGAGEFKAEIKRHLGCRKKVICVTAGAVLITLNWFVFIWAVNDGRLVECSLGYYINPLVNVLIGVTVLRERLSLWQFAAVVLAAAGVLKMTLSFGSLPWVALFLAASMTFYGLCKKITGLSAIAGMTIETALTAPFAAAFLLYLYSKGQGHPPSPDLVGVLLVMAGVVTATPLMLFAHSLNHLSLTIVGFLQYISPTISLLLGIFMYGEAFTPTHMFTFGLIWVAIILFTLAKTPPLAAIESRVSKFLGRRRYSPAD